MYNSTFFAFANNFHNLVSGVASDMKSVDASDVKRFVIDSVVFNEASEEVIVGVEVLVVVVVKTNKIDIAFRN